MKQKLTLLFLALFTTIGAWAQEVTTWSSDLISGLQTKDQLAASSGTGKRYAFRMPSTSKPGWCDFVNVSASSVNNVSSDYLFSIDNGSASGTYKLKRYSDGKYLSGNAAFNETGLDLTLTDRVPTNVNDYEDGLSNSSPFVSFDNSAGNHYNCGNVDFRTGAGGWSVYVIVGPLYIVKVNYLNPNGTSVRATDTHIVFNGTTVNTAAPEITNYRLVGASTPSVTVDGADVTINYTYTKLPQTSTSESPIYYTIKNTSCNKYAQYAGDAAEMALTSDRLESTANAFWFEAVAEDNLPTGVMAVKIHNLAAGKCVAATNSFTNDGITWYLKEDVYTSTPSIAINSNSTTWNNDSYGWNNKNGYGTSISNYKSTDGGSAWWVDVLTSADITEMEAIYAHQIDVRKANAIAQLKASSILFGDYETDDTPANTAYTTISSVVRANTEEALTAATSTINSALNTMYATVVDKKIVFKNTNRGNKYMVVTDAVQLGGADAADGRSEFKINYVSDTDGHFTIRNSATGRYIGNTPGMSASVQLSTTAGEFTIQSYGTDNKFAFICTNPAHGTHNSLHLNGSYNVVAWKADAESSASVWVIEASALTSEQIAAGVTAVRNQAISKITTYKNEVVSADRVGSGLNRYAATDAYTSAVSAIENATNAQEYETLLAMEGTLQTAYEYVLANQPINQPADGSFIRIRSVRTGMGYVNAEASAVYSGCLAVGSKGTSSIYYYKDGNLLAYNCGQYLIKNSDGGGFLGLGTTGTSGAAIVFGKGTKQVGTYYITFGGRYLYAGDNATSTDAAGSEADSNYDFWLEDVDVLPVAISSAGYASFCSPVAVTIPSGITAYKATDNDTYLTLTSIGTEGDVIPANEGVILEGSAGTYNFATTTGGSVSDNALIGTVAAIARPVGSYILATGTVNEEKVVGFFADGAETIPGFKAYLPASGGGGVKLFRFDDDDSTGIDAVNVEEFMVNGPIYNLAGQRVSKMQKGINIMNGKKILK